MSFDFLIEDLPYCPTDRAVGGIATRIWYAPEFFFNKIQLPNSNTPPNKVIKTKNITLNEGKQLAFIDVFLEQNSLTEKPIGGLRKWKSVSEFSISVLEMNARNLGFTSKVKNIPLVFFIPDANGRLWVMGNKQNAAYMSSYEGTTGKKYEDDSLITMSFTANAPLYLYEGSISSIVKVGGFTQGFSKGFRI
ncbi:hypothetical protein [Riemerella anatipestifer]|uniref:Uncharacterized protein n=1 Tax=Riemerella anatipestifer TaxID=34085 RepID=A0AAP3AN07_RIEAN|nr:hypothetical protein [Riemerella anatipestifer]AZZ59694.1 hypothetical protein AWB57_12085 [Riemerella anatipestifer]MCW0492501.1 hypothetical protein [Riemerella anatipestifer]MCW0511609.1 hypothetical protein [Riemerella anatipestifer]MCW0520110.1 hypothetical protein [Riemerella anatipestifer]MCW0524662.1 hypothetical protein [Riemerella anatipestifer]